MHKDRERGRERRRERERQRGRAAQTQLKWRLWRLLPQSLEDKKNDKLLLLLFLPHSLLFLLHLAAPFLLATPPPSVFSSLLCCTRPCAALIYCVRGSELWKGCPGTRLSRPSGGVNRGLGVVAREEQWNLFICSDFEKKVRPGERESRRRRDGERKLSTCERID